MYPVDASHPKRCRPQLPSDGRTKHLDTPTLTKLPETVSKHPKLWWWFRHTPCAQSTHCYLCCHVCFVKIFEFLLYVLNKELLPSKGIQLSILILIGYTTRYLSISSTTTYLVQLDSYRIIPTMFNIDMYYTFILQLNVSELKREIARQQLLLHILRHQLKERAELASSIPLLGP